MKNLFKGILFSILVSSLLSSCIDTASNNYTAENEQINLSQYINNLISNGYNIDTTALGVYYVRLTQGTGDYPVSGDTISIKYVGYLIDGSIFDTSFYLSADSCWTYVYKQQSTLASWDEITGLMNKGCKMEFIIPSSLAYGSSGSGNIPPYSSLVFVAVMKDIRKKK